MKRRVFTEWIRIVAGLFVFAFGVHLTIFANIGVAPWDCLGLGLSYHTPFNYGVCMTIISVIALGVDLLLKEKIGYGTIIDALLSGNFVQMFNSLNPLPLNTSVWLGVVIMLVGFVFIALGTAVYMKGCQCCGPRDTLLVGLGRRVPRLPIGVVSALLWGAVLLGGWLLGGPVGIGTLISTFGGSAVIQAVYSVIRFEPRRIVHRGVIEVTKELLARPDGQPRA